MKKLIISIVLLGIMALSFLIFDSNNKRNQRKKIYSNIPTFILSDINNEIISSSNLFTNKPVLLIYLDPYCTLCKEEIMQIDDHKELFSDCQIVLVSMVSAKIIKAFLEEINFILQENMMFLIDEDLYLYSTMEVRADPTIYIYDKDGMLIKKFEGFVKIPSILKYLININ